MFCIRGGTQVYSIKKGRLEKKRLGKLDHRLNMSQLQTKVSKQNNIILCLLKKALYKTWKEIIPLY